MTKAEAINGKTKFSGNGRERPAAYEAGAAYAGGHGAVTATVYGRKELKGIELKPECVDPDDIEMLQDLIISAVNEALRIADETMTAEMGKITGGMNLGF